jgi:hypothetical protein
LDCDLINHIIHQNDDDERNEKRNERRQNLIFPMIYSAFILTLGIPQIEKSDATQQQAPNVSPEDRKKGEFQRPMFWISQRKSEAKITIDAYQAQVIL